MTDRPQVVFSEKTSVLWSNDPMYNSHMFDMMQNFANDRLRYNGYLFLNEVLTFLRVPRKREGQFLGWVAREPGGDTHVVEFIITKRDEHDIITLEFNVDGDILDKVDWSAT